MDLARAGHKNPTYEITGIPLHVLAYTYQPPCQYEILTKKPALANPPPQRSAGLDGVFRGGDFFRGDLRQERFFFRIGPGNSHDGDHFFGGWGDCGDFCVIPGAGYPGPNVIKCWHQD